MSSNDKDYKETLFLPNTDFPMRANLPEREKEWLDRWQKLNIYKLLMHSQDYSTKILLIREVFSKKE